MCPFQNISRSTTIKDLQGKTHPAMPIFAMSIQYLQKHLLDTLTLRLTALSESDIKYIITVPAIWGIYAKQFMREAAIEAGIDSKRLKLALEPEVAAIWCESICHTLTGEKFLVVDLGGGTADISAHEKQADGSLKNIHAPSGGPWGGIYVDKNFTKFLREVFSEMSLEALKSDEMYDFFEINRDFEMKKRKCKFDSNEDILFRIPAALKDNAEKHLHQSLLDRLVALKYETKVFTRGKDKLGVNSSIMQSWFSEPISNIADHIQTILREERMRDVGLIFLVGGFAESPYVQQRIQKALPEQRLKVPGEPGLAVLKGAVMFGHKPGIISSRVMEYTYGISVYCTYDKNKYPVEKKVFLNGAWMVKKVFLIFVRVNEDVQVNSKVTHKSTPSGHTSYIRIYRTKERYPMYTTDPGCELLGTVYIENDKDIPLKEQPNETTFMFGDTELLIEQTNHATGKVESLTLDLNE